MVINFFQTQINQHLSAQLFAVKWPQFFKFFIFYLYKHITGVIFTDRIIVFGKSINAMHPINDWKLLQKYWL